MNLTHQLRQVEHEVAIVMSTMSVDRMMGHYGRKDTRDMPNYVETKFSGGEVHDEGRYAAGKVAVGVPDTRCPRT